MLILEAGNIKKYYSDRLIIEFDELKIYSGDKIGVVGQNGSGKTTLMNILSKEIEADQGFVKQNCDIAYIRQFSDESMEASPKALMEFGLSAKQNQKVFSGGEKTRIKIANAFGNEKFMLLADEPTANLDSDGIELLRQKLSEMDSFLLISHDRSLLDSLCNKILEIKNGKIKMYKGNYTFYKEKLKSEIDRMQYEYKQYDDKKARLVKAHSDKKKLASGIVKRPRDKGSQYLDSPSARSKRSQEKNMQRAAKAIISRIDMLEAKEKPKSLPQIRLDFSMTNPPKNKIVISAEKLSFSYGSKRIFYNTGFKIYNGSKTALLGGNGTGKTTLLDLISSKSSESIYIVPKTNIGYFHQGFENLKFDKSVIENVMQDSVQTQTVVRTILARLLIMGDDVYKNIGVLSGGEKIKVCFAKLFVSDANVLLLDEPTNYLDMMSIEALENVLREYEGTVLFASHDSTFINSTADRLLIFENQSVVVFEGTLQEYFNQQKIQSKN